MSPLEAALDSWAARDNFGGFAAVGALLWPGWEAKRVCRAPHRQDKSPSFSVFKNETGKWYFKDHATGEGGSIVDFVALSGLDVAAASRWLIERTGVASSLPTAPKTSQAAQQTRHQPVLDWNECAAAFSDEDAEQLCRWRGYSAETCSWLRGNRLIGKYDGCIAFPVHDDSGAVVGAHYRLKDGTWRFSPKGTRVRPLVFGDLANADQVHVFESQWDALAVRDAFRDWKSAGVAFVVTRGSANGALVASLVRTEATVFAWPQNDPEDKRDVKTGRTPAGRWLDAVSAHAGKPVMTVLTPAIHKDANDWIRTGATADVLFAAIEKAPKVENKAPPPTDSKKADAAPALFPLFRLDHLTARASERVFVAESEAGVGALETLGLLATTTIDGGATSVRTVDWVPLAGREVVIVPDNRARGDAYAAAVAKILTHLVPPARPSVLKLPGLPSGCGCVEWLDARDSQAPEDIAAELNSLIKAGRPAPASSDNGSEPDPQPIVARCIGELRRPDDQSEEELLKHRFLCRGGGLLVVGPTGIGKSSLCMQAMLLWGAGRDCFGIQPARPLKSLLIQAENDDGDLAEMRDGVLSGIDLTFEERKRALSNVFVYQEDSRVSAEYFAMTADPLLARHRPDLFWTDPALAYIGGEAGSQKDVGAFLRIGLNPLLHKYACGGVVLHHTNKPPSGKEKGEWEGSDLAYLGTGSAEWVNWPRAMIAIRGIGLNDVFELRLGKRGSRVGWKDQDGSAAFAKHIAHAKEPGVICWREADPSEVPLSGKKTKAPEVLEALGNDNLKFTEWAKRCQEIGISRSSFQRALRELLEDRKVHLDKIDRIYLKNTHEDSRVHRGSNDD